MWGFFILFLLYFIFFIFFCVLVFFPLWGFFLSRAVLSTDAAIQNKNKADTSDPTPLHSTAVRVITSSRPPNTWELRRQAQVCVGLPRRLSTPTQTCACLGMPAHACACLR